MSPIKLRRGTVMCTVDLPHLQHGLWAAGWPVICPLHLIRLTRQAPHRHGSPSPARFCLAGPDTRAMHSKRSLQWWTLLQGVQGWLKIQLELRQGQTFLHIEGCSELIPSAPLHILSKHHLRACCKRLGMAWMPLLRWFALLPALLKRAMRFRWADCFDPVWSPCCAVTHRDGILFPCSRS